MSDPHIWISPARRSGAPCIGGTRIPTYMAAETVYYRGIDEALAAWPDLSRAQVLVACWYEAKHGPRTLRRAWRRWRQHESTYMWGQLWDRVPDPPTHRRAEP